jgi:hypothetical protein
MKKLLTFAAVTLLTASLSFAQAAAGPGNTRQNSGKKAENVTKVNPQPEPPGVTRSKSKPAGKPSANTQKSQTEKNAPAPK